jgi:predicted Zn-dependent protease
MFLAQQLMFAGHVDEAHALMQRASAVIPQAPTYIQVTQGNVNWAVGRLDEAAAIFAGCVRQQPGHLGCRIWNMTTLAEAGRLEEALAELPELRRRFRGASVEEWLGARWSGPGMALKERRLAAWRRLVAAEQVAAR